MLMGQKIQKRLSDGWICQQILKWISSNRVRIFFAFAQREGANRLNDHVCHTNFQFFFTLHWFRLIFLQPLPFNWTLQLFREPKSSKGNLDTYQSNLTFYRTQTKRAYLIFHSQPPREKRRRNQAFWPERPEI